MSALHIILAAAAVWRLTHLLQVEDGPYQIFEQARARLRRASLAGAVDCFYCLSLWVAAPFAFALAPSPWEWMLTALALSALAILIDTLVARAEGKAIYFEQPNIEEKTPCPAAEMHANPNPPDCSPALSLQLPRLQARSTFNMWARQDWR
jgi:hypothetical protein